MAGHVRRAVGAVSFVLSIALAGCGDATLKVANEEMAANAPFVKVARGAVQSGVKHQGLDGDGGATGSVSGGDQNFYIAVNKAQLGSRWFMSAFLTQWHPSENTPMHSLGTRVVTFKLQNGKLFVFDATDGKAWSDTLDPSVVVEAYPVVTSHAPFNALTNSQSYVLFDPSAGLNRFSFVSDDFAASYWARFQVDLSYLQRFKTLADGVSFEQVFTGYTEVPGPGILGFDQPFRGSGTLALTLRRYSESPGFVPAELRSNRYFGSSNVQYVKNQPALKQLAVKWNLRPGMQPIQWRVSREVEALRADPRLAGVDVVGAISRGVTGWNQALGYTAFEVVPTGPDDSPGDDDKNFIVVDRNPGAGLAFANWRENPNTGELRGASVYFSSIFVEAALKAPAPDGGWTFVDAGAPADAGQVDAGEETDSGVVADAGQEPDAGPVAVPCVPELVLSQLFGGNSSTSGFGQDFVELHNRSVADLPLTGLSLQYASATGTSWQVVPLSGSIAAGGFFLVGLAQAADGGALGVTPNQVAGLNISATSGKLALVFGTAPLSGACPAGAIDFVGYGGAGCSEGGTTPAPAASNLTSVARRDACGDSNINALDFQSQAPAPRSSSSMAQLCVCTAPAPLTDGGVVVPDGGFSPPSPVDAGVGLVLAPPTSPFGKLSWDSLTSGSTCALKREVAALPAGMTRGQFIESVLTATVLHEVGHTLGLRHNFKGSFGNTSVMDYLRDDDNVLLVTPGAYDVAAVRHLYGLDPSAPPQPFCTDGDRGWDAECEAWDSTATPLSSDVGPRYTAGVREWLAGRGTLSYGQLWEVTRYVRGPTSEAQRLEAFDLLLGDVAPPLRAEVIALSATAGARADLLAGILLENLFLSSRAYRDSIGVAPALDDGAFRGRVIAVAKGIVVNSDAQLGFDNRRLAIDVLKELQTYDAYQALVEARASLLTERAGYNALGQALVDDLVRRLDAACSPYFR